LGYSRRQLTARQRRFLSPPRDPSAQLNQIFQAAPFIAIPRKPRRARATSHHRQKPGSVPRIPPATGSSRSTTAFSLLLPATFFVPPTSSPVIGDKREDLHQNEPTCRTNSRGRRCGGSHGAFGRETERKRERGRLLYAHRNGNLSCKNSKIPNSSKIIPTQFNLYIYIYIYIHIYIYIIYIYKYTHVLLAEMYFAQWQNFN